MHVPCTHEFVLQSFMSEITKRLKRWKIVNIKTYLSKKGKALGREGKVLGREGKALGRD